MKRKLIELPNEVNSCVVIGTIVAASTLTERLTAQYPDRLIEMRKDQFVTGQWDYGFFVDGDMKQVSAFIQVVEFFSRL